MRPLHNSGSHCSLITCCVHTGYAAADTLEQAKALDNAPLALATPETRQTHRSLLKFPHSRHSGHLALRALVALPVAGIIFIAPVPKRPLFVEDAALCTGTRVKLSLPSYVTGVNGADRHSHVAK